MIVQPGDQADLAALRQVVRSFLAQHAGSARVREAMRSGYDGATWHRLAAELGVVGLLVPEEHGGAGAGLAEVAVVLEELGRTLLPSPYLSTALAGGVLGAATDGLDLAAEVLPELAAGSCTAAFAPGATGRAPAVTGTDGRLTGTVPGVVDGPGAGIFLVGTADALYAVRAGEARLVPTPPLDQTRAQGRLELADAAATRLGDGDLARWAEDLFRLGLALEAVGTAEECLARTVEHLKTRVQFGRPLGAFQALRHRCADVAVGVRSARATAAAAVAASGSDRFGVVAPLAKLHCSRVLRHASAETIQLHGGIGFTWEHDAQLFFKRAKATELLHGTPSELRSLVGRRAGLLP
jgi:alkylation response protein AidB-like acyl-CoA dehydrogenase